MSKWYKILSFSCSFKLISILGILSLWFWRFCSLILCIVSEGTKNNYSGGQDGCRSFPNHIAFLHIWKKVPLSFILSSRALCRLSFRFIRLTQANPCQGEWNYHDWLSGQSWFTPGVWRVLLPLWPWLREKRWTRFVFYWHKGDKWLLGTQVMVFAEVVLGNLMLLILLKFFSFYSC